MQLLLRFLSGMHHYQPSWLTHSWQFTHRVVTCLPQIGCRAGKSPAKEWNLNHWANVVTRSECWRQGSSPSAVTNLNWERHWRRRRNKAKVTTHWGIWSTCRIRPLWRVWGHTGWRWSWKIQLPAKPSLARCLHLCREPKTQSKQSVRMEFWI